MMKLIGTKDFYRRTLAIAVPIMIQNGITNFVSMLDNIMVGRIGTEAMSGVSIVNQLTFVFMLCLFGGTAGIGIFTAQFVGKGDTEGVRYTMRMKVVLCVLLTVLGIAVFNIFGTELISLWLKGDRGTGDAAATLASAKEYLFVTYFGMLPFALSFSYSGTLRENGETVVPMAAGIAAVFINLAGNYVLIYGKLGLPALGVTGAALATVISRYVEFGIVAVWTHMNPAINPFAVGLYRSLYIPVGLVKSVAPKAAPLLFNEFMWSLGQTVNNQQYSLRGLDVVAAMNIFTTICNVFNIVMISMGDTIAIMLGQELGKKKKTNEGIKEEAAQLTAFTQGMCIIAGIVMFAISGWFPGLYNTSDSVRYLAMGLIRLGAVFMPLLAYENSSYFTLRSGGKTWITLAFDSLYTWTIPIPLLMLLVHFTDMSLLPLYTCVQCTSFVKCLIGFLMVKSGFWINDLTNYERK
jgi:putative MATE family efflux protein